MHMNKIDLTDSLEKIAVKIFPNSGDGSAFVARQIADLIKQKEKEGKKTVIGLATGSSPKTLYAHLVRMHNEEGLSFKNVITFNLDQYYPMEKDALQSYHYFMRKNLFEHTDINPDNYHLPDGLIAKDKVKEHCLNYEKQIEDAVKYEGERPACDGLAEDEKGNIYFGAFEQQSIIKRNTNGDFSLLSHDKDNFVWPDGLAYRNGYVYVTLGQWNRLPSFNDGKDLRKPPYLVVKIKTDNN